MATAMKNPKAVRPKVNISNNGRSVVGPVGRMTHPLLTRYHIGDRVLLTHDAEDLAKQGITPGETGVIRRIGVCDPNDGEDTTLNFGVALDEGGDIDAAEYQRCTGRSGRSVAWAAPR